MPLGIQYGGVPMQIYGEKHWGGGGVGRPTSLGFFWGGGNLGQLTDSHSAFVGCESSADSIPVSPAPSPSSPAASANSAAAVAQYQGRPLVPPYGNGLSNGLATLGVGLAGSAEPLVPYSASIPLVVSSATYPSVASKLPSPPSKLTRPPVFCFFSFPSTNLCTLASLQARPLRAVGLVGRPTCFLSA